LGVLLIFGFFCLFFGFDLLFTFFKFEFVFNLNSPKLGVEIVVHYPFLAQNGALTFLYNFLAKWL
jgi:hypothetical protein